MSVAKLNAIRGYVAYILTGTLEATADYQV